MSCRLFVLLMLASLAWTRVATASFSIVDRANLSSQGAQVTGFDTPVNGAEVSRDGRFVVFDSFGPSLVPNDTNNIGDVFVRDLALGTTVRVSVHTDGTQALGVQPTISATGRFVAFVSFSSKLIGTDTDHNGFCDVGCKTTAIDDVFVRDRDTDEDGVFDEAGAVSTKRVSLTSTGAQIESDTPCRNPSISGDGRWIVFTTQAKLVPEDTNDEIDVYAADRVDGTIARISVASDGTQGDADSGAAPFEVTPVTNGDGRFVAFGSTATTLVANDGNHTQDLFLRDRDTDEDGIFDEPGHVATTRISVTAAGAELAAPELIGSISLSSDGRYVGWASGADAMVAGGGNATGSDVFVLDRESGNLDRFGTNPSGPDCCGNVIHEHGISDDGNRIVYESNRLVTVTNGQQVTVRSVSDVYVATRGGGTQKVTSSPDPTQPSDPNIFSYTHAISGDARVLLIGSTDPTLAPNDTNGRDDVIYAAEGPLVFPTGTPGAGGPTPTPTASPAPHLDDASAAKAAVKCQKQADAGGAKLVGAALKGLDKCGQSLLACAQTVDAEKRAACKTKALAGCTKELEKVATAGDARAAALVAKCGAVSFGDAASPGGLGYGDETVADACGGSLDGFAALGTCLAGLDSCVAARLASLVLPRVHALMADAGVASGVLDGLPCLQVHAGDGAGVADAPTAKLVVQCLKTAGKATTKLVGLAYKSLLKCHETALACVEQKPGDAKCLAKAGKTCGGALAKIAEGQSKLESTVVGKCAGVDFATLAAANGADLGALASDCGRVDVAANSVPTYATCLARGAVCGAEFAVSLAAPRSASTFGLAGVTFGSAYCEP